MSDIQYVGRINRKIFKAVTDDIQTDEVIITNVQIEHIKERHPGIYENFGSYIAEMIENPDYILEANKPYAALVLKSFDLNGEHFKAILRLKTVWDNPGYKNSVISFWKIDEKTLKRLLKNKKVLYKRE